MGFHFSTVCARKSALAQNSMVHDKVLIRIFRSFKVVRNHQNTYTIISGGSKKFS